MTGDWPRFPEVQALLTLRDAARARRAELQLALDRPADVDDLRALIDEHPDREHHRHLLMRALHRAGRRAEALAAYDAAYRYACATLGLEPAAELKELQHRILNGNPAPHSLPATTGFFVGRTEELETAPQPGAPDHRRARRRQDRAGTPARPHAGTTGTAPCTPT